MNRLALLLGIGGMLALGTGACTSTTHNNPQRDAGNDVIHQFDGGTHDDGGQDDGGNVTCTKSDFTAANESADYQTNGTDEAFFYTGSSRTTSPYDMLSIELYPGYGVSPSIGPGTYTLGSTSAEQDYATCGVCVLLYAGCDDTAQTCTTYYFATTGTLAITALDNASGFVASLSNAKLAEVTLDSSYHSTKVPGGDTWCIDSYSIDTPLTTGLPCTTNDDCTGTPDTPLCDTQSGSCVECLDNTQCASSTYGTICAQGQCGQCGSAFDCTNAATPACMANQTTGRAECVAGVTCTGDDAGGAADDGPVGARTLTLATAMDGDLCDATSDTDWYKFVTSATGNVTVNVSWTVSDADIDFAIFDSTGAVVDTGQGTTNPETVTLTSQAAGTYYVMVYAYDVGSATGALAYQITVSTN